MPAADTTRARRSTRLLPTTLFWAGVALAPLAVLLFLVSTGAFAMQIASVLAVVALALMGVALWLGRDGDNVRVEVEEIVFEELDALRGELRNDIAHATRTSHKQLGERIVALSETVEVLRGQLDYVRGQLERTGQPQAHPQAGPAHHNAPGNLLRHTETVQVTTRQTTLVDSSDGRRDGTVYGSRPQPPEYGSRSQQDYGGRARVDYPAPADAGVPSHFGGRATVPQPRQEPRTGDIPPAFGGRTYGAAQVPLQRAPEPSYSPPAPPPAIDSAPREESWTEQLLRERLNRRERDPVGRDTGWEERTGEHTAGGRRRTFDADDYSAERMTGGLSAGGTGGFREPTTGGLGGAGGFREPTTGGAGGAGGFREPTTGGAGSFREPTTGGPSGLGSSGISGYSTSDRWAEVRSDERGRELQMGEFRSQMREGERGSEIRIEDRWAAVRREDDRRREEQHRRDEWGEGARRDERSQAEWSQGEWSQGERREERADGPRRSPASRERERSRALPPAPAGPPPSWASTWANAGRDEEQTYRWNDGREPDNRLPRRIVDFEHTDDRWR